MQNESKELQKRTTGQSCAHLTGDGQRQTELRLSGAKLAEDFGDAACLDAAAEQLVQLLGAGRHLDDLGAFLVVLGGRRKAHRHQLLRLRLSTKTHKEKMLDNVGVSIQLIMLFVHQL